MKGFYAAPKPRDCAICSAVFLAVRWQNKYCGPVCARQGERKSWREYGQRNKDARSLYHRTLYAKDPEAAKERTREYHRTEAGKRASRIAAARQREKHPEKIAARNAVTIAVRKKTLNAQPCSRCGALPTHAHHPDYAKPLEVIWLCVTCHNKEHGNVRLNLKEAA